MKHYDAVIFNWDGTLMDSTLSMKDNFLGAMNEANLQVPDYDVVRKSGGFHMEKLFGILYPDMAPEEMNTRLDLFKAAYIRRFHQLDHSKSHFFKSTETVLIDLIKNDIQCAVAASRHKDLLDIIFEQYNYGLYFNSVKGICDKYAKPDVLMLQEILDELKIDVSRALLVGNSINDLKMAQDINMASIGITTGESPKNWLLQYNPIAVIDDLNQLLPYVLKV